LGLETSDQRRRRNAQSLSPLQYPADHGITLLGARQRLDHVAGKRGMQIAEEADGATVRTHVHEHMGGGRLGDALGNDLAAVLVERLEILAVDRKVLRLLTA